MFTEGQKVVVKTDLVAMAMKHQSSWVGKVGTFVKYLPGQPTCIIAFDPSQIPADADSSCSQAWFAEAELRLAK